MRQSSLCLQVSGLLLSLSFVSTSAYGHCGGHCEGVAHAAPSVTIGQNEAASTTYSAASGLYQVDSRGMPILNSNAGSMGSLYIDFDGGNWYGALGAYDTDGDTTTYSAYEQDDIYKAWRDVSTHFAMFDINVTTIEPNRQVTPTASVIVSNDMNGGGANYHGFGGTVATGATAAHFARVRSTGITHELGHIMTLGHQSVADSNGNLVTVYRGADQWNTAPIMGNDGAGSKFSSWQQGVRPAGGGLTEPQDDLAQIANNIITTYDSFSGGTYAGDGFRVDDHGNNRGAATLLPSGGGAVPYNVQTSGVLERYGDKDFFEIEWAGGDISIRIEAERNLAAGPEYASSARTVARLIGPSGWIASRWPSNPSDMLEVINKSNLAAGTYWIRIDSPGGYSDLGAYNIWVDNGIAAAAQSESMQFAPVPEPSSLALLGIGGLMLARRRRR